MPCFRERPSNIAVYASVDGDMVYCNDVYGILFATYVLQPSRLIVRSGLDIPTFATRRLHAWATRGGRWNCLKFCLNADFHVTFRDLLHAVKLRHGTDGFTSPPKRILRIFFALKIPTTSAGCEPANLGTKGQHATSRPPNFTLWPIKKMFFCNMKCYCEIIILILSLMNIIIWISYQERSEQGMYPHGRIS